MLKKLWTLFMWITFILVCLALWHAPEGFDQDERNGAVITFFVIAMYYCARYYRLRAVMHILASMKADNLLHSGLMKEREEEERVLKRRKPKQREEERKPKQRKLKQRKPKQRWGLRL